MRIDLADHTRAALETECQRGGMRGNFSAHLSPLYLHNVGQQCCSPEIKYCKLTHFFETAYFLRFLLNNLFISNLHGAFMPSPESSSNQLETVRKSAELNQ